MEEKMSMDIIQTTTQKSLKDEWSLLLHNFLKEDGKKQNKILNSIKEKALTVDQIKMMRKELSSKRKKMNQSIEKIKIKLEQVATVIENLELVGSDTASLNKEVSLLSNEGEKISETILALDSKIKKLHELQELLS